MISVSAEVVSSGLVGIKGPDGDTTGSAEVSVDAFAWVSEESTVDGF